MDNVVAGSQLAVEPPPVEKPIDDGNDFVPQVRVSAATVSSAHVMRILAV